MGPKELSVAYEPVGAIGKGRAYRFPSRGHALSASHRARFGAAVAAQVQILYGGSVKLCNAAALLSVANFDGVLVGGASLKAVDYLTIIQPRRSWIRFRFFTRPIVPTDQ